MNRLRVGCRAIARRTTKIRLRIQGRLFNLNVRLICTAWRGSNLFQDFRFGTTVATVSATPPHRLAEKRIASTCWPGRMMGLTLRSSELAEHDADGPNQLAWTNLAQGAGSFLSPLIASVLVGSSGRFRYCSRPA
jgi:hypothetical protein